MDNGTPQTGETVTPEAPKNATPAPTPNSGNEGGNAGEAEKLRKELEQARMREQQLLNEKKAEEERKAADEAKKLEEQSEFKTLFEQEKAKREALEKEREAEDQRKELDTAKAEVLGGFSDEVKATAKDLGIELAAADDASKEAFKEKLEKINTRITSTANVTPNNPNRPSSQTTTLSGPELAKALKKPGALEEIISKRPGFQVMMAPKQ